MNGSKRRKPIAYEAHHTKTLCVRAHTGRLEADYIVANSPFNMKSWGGDHLRPACCSRGAGREDRCWKFVPLPGNANFAWGQHMIHHLAPACLAGFVLVNGSMSSNQSGEGEIRRNLIEGDLVDCIVALPDIAVAFEKNGKEKPVRVTLNGVALFDRKRRTTEYKQADSGYVSAWYLDEDYDGDCFVDCQMFFDFKKTPALSKLGVEVPEEEFALRLTSEPFPVRGYKRIAVKVVDVYGNESVVVRDLA